MAEGTGARGGRAGYNRRFVSDLRGDSEWSHPTNQVGDAEGTKPPGETGDKPQEGKKHKRARFRRRISLRSFTWIAKRGGRRPICAP